MAARVCPLGRIPAFEPRRVDLGRRPCRPGTADGRVFIRYLPRGVTVGTDKPYLTIGTYPVADAFAVSSTLASGGGSVKVRIGGALRTRPRLLASRLAARPREAGIADDCVSAGHKQYSKHPSSVGRAASSECL